MELIHFAIDFLFNINERLTTLVQAYGMLFYALIALIIFCEVGLVVAPFLPGDSMLFTIGALCATGAMDITIAFTVFPIAAIAGANFNRLIGVWIGHKVFTGKDGRIFNQANLEKAQEFFDKNGPKAVTISRFLPFFRTFIPLVAGMTQMPWKRFFPYSVLGGAAWVFVFAGGGYLFGNIPIIRDHFEIVILFVICVSGGPIVVDFIKGRRKAKSVAGSIATES